MYENDNDISRVYAQKVDRQFRKDFAKFLPSNLRSEEPKSKINELNIELIEAKEKISSLTRLVESKNNKINDLELLQKTESKKIDEFQQQIKALKSEMEKRKETPKTITNELTEKLIIDNYRCALSKYVTWFGYAEKQLELMKTILQEHGEWTEENRYKIYFAYKSIKPTSVTDDNLASLCEVSVLNYKGIEDIESISEFENCLKFHNISTQTDELESGFLMSSQNVLSQEQNPSQSFENLHELSTEDLRLLDSLEKIQKLECDNAYLKEQIVILAQRGAQNTLLEEQKRDLEHQLSIIKKQNAKIIDEHEKLKDTIRCKLFKNSFDRESANDLLKNLTNVRERNKVLEKKLLELESKTSNVVSEDSKEIAQFFKQRYQKEIDELKKKLAKHEPSYKSETTMIYRFEDNNPLDEAHEQHLIKLAAAVSTNNNKRRKLDMSCMDEEINEKIDDSEALKDLRVKLEQLERSLKIQKDFALQYRQIVTALTGYQIKMREEGLCEVQSVFDQGGEFCFKKRSDDAMDLLDNECAQQWKFHVTNYLAKYDSVPAFLAAVLLTLIENDASVLSNTFLNYTKDPQQTHL